MIVKWDKWQSDFLACEGDKILCTGRQIGKSEVCAADAVEWVIKHPGLGPHKPVVMIAPLEKQAQSLFQKALDYATRKYPDSVKKRGKDRPTLAKIRFKNGTEIHCYPVGTGLNVRFLTISRLYCDECARIPPEVFVAIQPAILTTGAKQIWLSTLNGAQGEFYECWINKDGAWDSFSRFSKSTEEAIDEREIWTTWTKEQKESALQKLEQARLRMSKAEYGQEYLGIAAENLSRVFSNEIIKKCCVLKRRGAILKGRKYYCGADISGLGEDETVVSVVQKFNNDIMEQVESIISKRVYTTDTSQKITFLHDQYRFRSIGIDDNGVGFGVFSELLREPKTKRVTFSLNNERRMLDDEGDKTKRLLKEEMYMRLLAWMEQGRIKLLDDEEIIESLKSIQFELVMRPGEATKTRIFGNYSHCVESLIRALWLAVEDKTLNLWAA